MFNYPNGKKFNNLNKSIDKPVNLKASFSAANRGMNLEESINISNDFYVEQGRALITKRPTPINVVKVDYTKGARIVDAYFEKQSTTDYNGIYKSKYLDTVIPKDDGKKVTILDDIDFELELMYTDKINVDYIQKLISTVKFEEENSFLHDKGI